MKVIPHIVLKDDHSSHRLWVRVGGMKGSLINVFFSRKPRSYSFTPQLMSTPEGFPYGEGEHSLMGMIPRSISFWTSNGFSLLVFASVVELLISGERCAFLAAVIRNFCEACKSLYGSVRAEWLGNRLWRQIAGTVALPLNDWMALGKWLSLSEAGVSHHKVRVILLVCCRLLWEFNGSMHVRCLPESRHAPGLDIPVCLWFQEGLMETGLHKEDE